MKFPEPLIEGRFLSRYKRFFADVEIGGKQITAHVPNTGSLKGCLEEGAPCRLSLSHDPNRKLPYTLQMIQSGSAWVGINTGLANDLVWEAWSAGTVKSWKEFTAGQREVKIHAHSRLDIALWAPTKDLPADTRVGAAALRHHKFVLVEVKNVTLAEHGLAMFPDSVTERGQKHLRELMELHSAGHRTEIVFVVQRTDCQAFAPADGIDPVYGQLLRQAIKTGVKISAYPCTLTATEIVLKPKPLALEI